MKLKRFGNLITATALLLSLASTTVTAYDYGENISPPAENVSQIIGDNNTVIFIDVPSNHWAKDQIEYFAEQGIVAGYEDGSFRPENGVTREEFCRLLVSTFNAPLDTPNSPSFSDVEKTRWSYPYVEVCKEFLTGYANPFGGLPTFHPTEYATREDIAVALVRMMGYTDGDANDKNYAVRKFLDGGNISVNLVPYVSIACEKGLISGYPDGTLGPTNGITRAETVALLNRATKQAVTNITAELELSANVLYSKNGKTATINITTEPGTTVTVNGTAVKMQNNYDDMYEGNFVYEFKEGEESQTFTVEGYKNGKSKSVKVTAQYVSHGPVITISDIPKTVNTKTLNLSGTVTVPGSSSYSPSPTLTVNGSKVYVSYYDNTWSTKVTLEEGDNTIVFIATTSDGETTKTERIVKYVDNGPQLTITKCPSTSETDSIEISGKVEDANYSTYNLDLTINDESVYVRSDGTWSERIDLKYGENVLNIVATNPDGNQDSITKTITFDYAAPTVTIVTCPERSETSQVQIYGLIEDVNDSKYELELYVDGIETHIGYDGKWNQTVYLEDGKNDIKIVAINSMGKRTEITKTIMYGYADPEIEILQCPEVTSSNKVTITGTTTNCDTLYVNGEECSLSRKGDFSVTLDLDEGDNVISFKALNEIGEKTTLTKYIFVELEEEDDDIVLEDDIDDDDTSLENDDDLESEDDDDIASEDNTDDDIDDAE